MKQIIITIFQPDLIKIYTYTWSWDSEKKTKPLATF